MERRYRIASGPIILFALSLHFHFCIDDLSGIDEKDPLLFREFDLNRSAEALYFQRGQKRREIGIGGH